MPSVLTGANLANRELIYLGVSGDGDSASIGLGQFAHCLRRGVNMVYIVENNGVYGLTKGQFSATADRAPRARRARCNADEPIDLVGMALLLGATFVARSFSGDKAQLVPLIKAALLAPRRRVHRRDQPVRRLQQPRRLDQELRLCPRAQRSREPPGRPAARASRSPPTTTPGTEVVGEACTTARHCGCASSRRATTRATAIGAMAHLQQRQAAGEIVTGLLYVDPDAKDLHDQLGTVDTPLNRLGEAELCPGAATLDAINAAHR